MIPIPPYWMLFLQAMLLCVPNHGYPVHQSSTQESLPRPKLPFYYPPNGSHLWKGPTFSHASEPVTDNSTWSPEIQALIGTRFLLSQLGISSQNLSRTSSLTDAFGTTHLYFIHTIQGIPVVNHDCAVHVQKGLVVAWASAFSYRNSSITSSKIRSPYASFPSESAVSLAREQLPNTELVPDAPFGLAYVEIPDGTIAYAYHMELRDDSRATWFKVYLDAQSGQIVHAIDYVKFLSYKVVPYYSTNPLLQGIMDIRDPEYISSSPLGWTTTMNETGGVNSSQTIRYHDTRGNNIEAGMFLLARRPGPRYASMDSSGGFRANWDLSRPVNDTQNQEAAIMELFYLGNFMHDFGYQYGFTEEAGNFQKSNFGKNGSANDPVKMMAQVTGADSNNANFKSAPDGRSGILSVSLFDANDGNGTTVRDGAFEPAIVLHEYVHGISTRMTGGAKNPECLQDLEGLALGEGWSDAITMFVMRNVSEPPETQFMIGSYVANNPKGIRQYPYTTDMNVNPLTLAHLNDISEPHDMGEVWAANLNEVYWYFVSKHGSSANMMDSKQSSGNIILFNLIFQGLLLQPCHPDFLSARDALFAADKLMYQSKYECDLWKGFAKRGMGFSAKQFPYVNGFETPSNCQNT